MTTARKNKANRGEKNEKLKYKSILLLALEQPPLESLRLELWFSDDTRKLLCGSTK